MSAERIGSESVPLTQELLAQMLGTRRSSVTVAAGMLQKAGLIAHTRGDVRKLWTVKDWKKHRANVTQSCGGKSRSGVAKRNTGAGSGDIFAC